MKHQAHGGSHDKANPMQLCWHHHRLVHEGGWSVRFDDRGEVMAIRPNGNVLGTPRRPEPCSARNVVNGNRARGISVDPTTCVPLWRGESLSLGLVVAGLFEADERASLE